MKNQTIVLLEDDSIAIMYYELWCAKFNVNLILYKEINEKFLIHFLDSEKIIVIDLSIVSEQIIKNKFEKLENLITQSNVYITTGFSELENFMGKMIYSKSQLLQKIEKTYRDENRIAFCH